MNESVQGETRELFSVVYFATGLKKARAEGKKCHVLKCVYLQLDYKRRDPRVKKCHTKTMKNKKSWQNSYIMTLHAPLRQNTEEKKQGKELKVL